MMAELKTFYPNARKSSREFYTQKMASQQKSRPKNMACTPLCQNVMYHYSLGCHIYLVGQIIQAVPLLLAGPDGYWRSPFMQSLIFASTISAFVSRRSLQYFQVSYQEKDHWLEVQTNRISLFLQISMNVRVLHVKTEEHVRMKSTNTRAHAQQDTQDHNVKPVRCLHM